MTAQEFGDFVVREIGALTEMIAHQSVITHAICRAIRNAPGLDRIDLEQRLSFGLDQDLNPGTLALYQAALAGLRGHTPPEPPKSARPQIRLLIDNDRS
jgi:hypothetical protein